MSRAQCGSRSSFDTRDRLTDRLFLDLRRGEVSSRTDVLERIVRLYLPLCSTMARRYDGKGIELDDLVQVARYGLLKAIERYEPGLGRSFAAYAVPTISGELKRHFRDRAWVVRPPRRIQELRTEVTATRAELEQRLGRSATEHEIAEALDLAADDLQELALAMSCFRPTSIDAAIAGDGLAESAATLPYEDGGFEFVEDHACLSRELAKLDARSRRLLALRYGDELTQREIAALLGMTQMQVSRALARILLGLRTAFAIEDHDRSA
ncbi:sigma-70 family RNA polymerase sigma factor [Humibacillus xanthopallidus]|uniref:sigma-70 family RNA polymerase sigma factor n=1 Tax=Humibacillus xanthopallidus TaxID=412689 RepID=UPI00384A5491